MSQLQTWWRQRNDREQLLLQVSAGLLMAVLLVQALMLPAMAYRADSLRRLEIQGRTHADIVRALANGSGFEKSQSAGQPLSAVIADTSATHHLQIGRVRPGEYGSVSVSLSGVSAETLYAWIGDLRNRHNIWVKRASIRRGDKGLDANLHLERAR